MSIDIPNTWERLGLQLSRADIGANTEVVGDPCIVWDEDSSAWRMVFFAQPGGHGQAICDDLERGPWRYQGPLAFTNPELLPPGGTHKPFITLDARVPNRAAQLERGYELLTVSFLEGQKFVQRAWSARLAGPWTLEPEPLLARGSRGAFDEKHVDAVSGFYFADRREVLYFYMGYPVSPQPYPSAFGSALGGAIRGWGEVAARKLGVVLAPSSLAGHWASGWVGGFQLLPGSEARWIGLANASPTPPHPGDAGLSGEEPAPSLGGFAVCDEPFPITGWRWRDAPIERLEDIPEAAHRAGERVNLWRQHLLVTPDGLRLYYNSGSYGQEQIFAKRSARTL